MVWWAFSIRGARNKRPEFLNNRVNGPESYFIKPSRQKLSQLGPKFALGLSNMWTNSCYDFFLNNIIIM
jgi:hypothetical protein